MDKISAFIQAIEKHYPDMPFQVITTFYNFYSLGFHNGQIQALIELGNFINNMADTAELERQNYETDIEKLQQWYDETE